MKDTELSLKFRIARQMVVIKYPFSHRRTQGEKNEDARIMMESQEFQNIWQLIKAHTDETMKVKESEMAVLVYRSIKYRLATGEDPTDFIAEQEKWHLDRAKAMRTKNDTQGGTKS